MGEGSWGVCGWQPAHLSAVILAPQRWLPKAFAGFRSEARQLRRQPWARVGLRAWVGSSSKTLMMWLSPAAGAV